MTRLFGQAIAKVSTLTSAEQNAIATMILDELADEEKWKLSFAQSQDKLAKLADKVREDIKMGRVKKMGFDEL
jgi:restriction endonuclease